MGSQTGPKTAFEKWQSSLARAVGDRHWNAYDCDLRAAVADVNRHLQRTQGFVPLDWRLIKAMIWTETGADSPEWRTRPMQIGVAGDPGLASLLSGKEGGELILPPQWQARLTVATVRLNPSRNIRAGIGYLLMRMAYFDNQSVADETVAPFEITVKSGDTMEKIAKAQGSTTDILRRLNPASSTLRAGEALKCQKGKVQRVVVGWRRVTTLAIAQRYNGGGDFNYQRKLDYAYSLVKHGREAACG